MHWLDPPGGNAGSVALYPSKQVQKYPPLVLLQFELIPQSPVFRHSSMSDKIYFGQDFNEDTHIKKNLHTVSTNEAFICINGL